MLDRIERQQSINLRRLSRNRAEEMGFYRWVGHEEVKASKLVEMLQEQCGKQVGEGIVLVINDTSEINLQSHVGRIKREKLGVVGNNRDVGFFIHPSLVLGLDGKPIGLSSVQLWERQKQQPNQPNQPNQHQGERAREYPKLPIEEKESYKWLKAAKETQSCLSQARQITMIGDRESDVYEEWASIPDERTDLLIRSCRDRKIAEGQSLYSHLSQQPSLGSYSFWLPADKRRNRQEREVNVEVRIAQVHLLRPKKTQGDYPTEVGLWAIEVRELSQSVPVGETPLLWRLLTTHPVQTFEQALQIITWYSWRWRIEELFALLKQSGFDLEASQVESSPAIQSLLMLALQASLKVMALIQARSGDSKPIQSCFDTQEITVLQKVAPTLEGKTKKQKNPFPKHTLGWAAWVIARLGGWKGYASERPPGIKTFFAGLQILASYSHFHQLVCKQ